ncbi:MAG: 2Fe-2S iron-sulfur cluster-binding protein, partial [Paracoccaceae bacterium]
ETKTKSLSVTINGNEHRVEIDPKMPLLYALRDYFGLRATRFGCGEATCGACTVIVNGRAVMSCDLPIGELEGATIETAEVLNTEPPHPILAELLSFQAGQCGYCLPGIANRAKFLLGQEKKLDRAEIATALDDHLCRCGSHNRVLDAIESLFNKKEG